MSMLYSTVRARVVPGKDYKVDLTGKTVIITGANAGIGFEATLKLVANGAKRIVFGVRSITKGEAARTAIAAKTGRASVIDVWQLDMLDYASIKAFAHRAETEIDQLDYVILNAGVMVQDFSTSRYGWETTLQVNHLATTLLALRLLPKLKSNTRPGFTPVLEMIGSGLHESVSKLQGDEPSQNPLAAYNTAEKFDGLQGQYAISKLFLMYSYAHLSEMGKPGSSETKVFVQVVCPGFTQSGLGAGAGSVMRVAKAFLARSTENGARTYIAGLTLGDKGHGKFWRYDRVQPPASLLVDAKAKERQDRVWNATLEALRRDVPDVDRLVVEASR